MHGVERAGIGFREKSQEWPGDHPEDLWGSPRCAGLSKVGGPCPYLAEIAGPWDDRQVGMREAWEGHMLPDGAGLSPPTRSAPRVAPVGWAGVGGAVSRREGSSPLPTAPSPLMERRGQL